MHGKEKKGEGWLCEIAEHLSCGDSSGRRDCMRCMSLLMVYKASQIPVAPHSPEKPAKGGHLVPDKHSMAAGKVCSSAECCVKDSSKVEITPSEAACVAVQIISRILWCKSSKTSNG